MDPAPPTTNPLDPILAEAKSLRDRIKVKIHLASMDARDTFDQLQPRLAKLEQELKKQGAEVREELEDQITTLRDALRKLRDHVI